MNAIANFTFLTQETNLEVSRKDPSKYLPEYEARTPGAIASHWIPMDPELWKVKNYPRFLEERRKLLAEAANDFLDRLSVGNIPEAVTAEEADFVGRAVAYIPGGIEDDDEEARLIKTNEWVANKGLPRGEFSYELLDPETGNVSAILDLAWPDGLQLELSQPVALLIDEGPDVEEAASQAGFRFSSATSAFKRYVRHEILAEVPVEASSA